MMTKTNKDNWILFALIVCHSALLFYHYLEIPFSHDELSAINRCRFLNFNDLIQQGVKPDGHPEGVQILLWGLTKSFGYTEWALKLPFVLAGIFSTIFLFKSTKIVFKMEAAILASCLFIGLEYFLTQQAYIRPYSIGLFLNLGLFFFILKVLNTKKWTFYYLFIILFSTLSYYTHYFSFLQSIMLWFGVFSMFYKNINVKYFIRSFCLSIIFFLPHLGITSYQLSMGGLGWLGKPELNFISSFYLNLFNSSLVFLIIAVILLMLSLFQYKKHSKMYAFLILLWLLPLLILWTYSVFNAPVLQPSALYFSSPFLIILIGNSINIFSKNSTKALLISILLFISIGTLILSKHFYKQRYFSPIKAFINQSNLYLKNNPKDSVLILWQGNSNYFNFYNLKFLNPLKVIFTDTSSYFVTRHYNTIICNELPPEKMHQVGEQFPYLYAKDFNFSYTFYALKNEAKNSPLYKRVNNFQFTFTKNEEWSRSFSFNLLEEGITKNMFLELIPQLNSTINNAELVMELYDKNERIDWRSIPLKPNSILSAKLKDIIKSEKIEKHNTAKIFIWNKDKKKMQPIDALLIIRIDNPFEYSGNWD